MGYEEEMKLSEVIASMEKLSKEYAEMKKTASPQSGILLDTGITLTENFISRLKRVTEL